MIIDCVSDLHGYHPKLEGGDLLIVAGDLTARDEASQIIEFYKWLEKQAYRKKIVTPGNHDNYFQKCNTFSAAPFHEELAIYLCDSGIEFEGLKIWGSPWTLKFSGMNPHCMAFTCDTEEELAEKWALIPDDVDILITHGPPYGILDKCSNGNVGSKSLLSRSASFKNLRLFCFGHIHEAYACIDKKLAEKVEKDIPCEGYSMPVIVNASHVNERYQPVNNPIRVIL